MFASTGRQNVPVVCAEQRHRGGEIDVVDAQVNAARRQVGIERRLDPEHVRDHVVRAACIAVQIEVVLARLNIELRQARGSWSAPAQIVIAHRRDLRHAFGHDSVRGVDAHRRVEFRDGF